MHATGLTELTNMTIPPHSSEENERASRSKPFQEMSDSLFASTFLPVPIPQSERPLDRSLKPNGTAESQPTVPLSDEPQPVGARVESQYEVEEPTYRDAPSPQHEPPPAPVGSRDFVEKIVERGVATETLPLAVFAVVASMAVMPMLLTHLGHLSHMPHRAHYGVVLVGFIALVVRRWYRAAGEPNFRFTVVDVALLVGAGIAFATASRVDSPWVGVFSCILLAGVFLRRLPSVDGIGYTGPLAFLFLLLPLPLGFDEQLIKSLQAFVTGCSSRLLDLVNVNHLVSGNVLELPGSQLFIDEACSGIQSLFAMLTCVAFFAAWTRRPVVLTVPLLAASVVMCTIVNILRIVIVVHAELRGINLVSGWQHECLGSGLFVVALWLVYCSEGFFLFLLAPIINPATGTPDNRSARFWNNLTQGIHGAVFGVVETERSEPSQPVTSGLFGFRLPPVFTRLAMFAATVVFAFCGISQHVGGADRAPLRSLSQIEEQMFERSESLQEDSLPELLGPWRRKSFERIDRSKGPITDSVSWVYRSPFYKATISLDYPFFGAHNVSECYHLTGWDVQEKVTTGAGYSKATLNRPFGEVALLFYDVFDASGTVELESVKGKLSERMKDFENSSERPTWQLQLIIQSDFGLSTMDLNDIETAFVEIRDELRAQIMSSNGGGQIHPLESGTSDDYFE